MWSNLSRYYGGLSLLLAGLLLAAVVQSAQLRSIATLPAHSFVVGPTSGQYISPKNGADVPFSQQPVQGFSDLIFHQQQWLAIADNGFGSKQNSADHLLMVFRLNPGWKSANGGSGVLEASLHFVLSDPHNKVAFPIIAEREYYPELGVLVDPEIRKLRLLTGADFDIESFRVASDGSYWFGDEFGPFLLHTNSSGELLEAPIELPGLWSANNPLQDSQLATVQHSGGFEGMAFSADKRALILLLEKPLVDESGQVLNAYRFDLVTGKFTGPEWSYQMHSRQHRVGALAEAPNGAFVLIERDRQQGKLAAYKKVFLFNPETQISKEIADLLVLDDKLHLTANSGSFRYPFSTIESIVMPDPNTLIIINDNNYPFSTGRHEDNTAADDSEMIVIRL